MSAVIIADIEIGDVIDWVEQLWQIGDKTGDVIDWVQQFMHSIRWMKKKASNNWKIDFRHQRQGCVQVSSRVVMSREKTYGVALAEIARRVSVSTPAILKIIQRAN